MFFADMTDIHSLHEADIFIIRNTYLPEREYILKK